MTQYLIVQFRRNATGGIALLVVWCALYLNVSSFQNVLVYMYMHTVCMFLMACFYIDLKSFVKGEWKENHGVIYAPGEKENTVWPR